MRSERKRDWPSGLLTLAALLGCVGVFSAIELHSSREALRWGGMTLLLIILHCTVPRRTGRQAFPLWAYTVPVLLVAAATAWDVRREAPAGAYEEISNGIERAPAAVSQEIRARTRAGLAADGTLSKWRYAALDQYLSARNVPRSALLSVSQAQARARLEALLNADATP